MAVYKRGEAEAYSYEFRFRGRRFRGSTGCASRREAEAFVRRKREETVEAHKGRKALGRDPLTWGVAASRYWQEAGQHHAPDTKTLPSLEWLTRHIGGTTPPPPVLGLLGALVGAQRRGGG